MSIELDDFFMFDLSEAEASKYEKLPKSDILPKLEKERAFSKSRTLPGLEKEMGTLNTSKWRIKQAYHKAIEATKKQELNILGKPGGRLEKGVLGVALAAAPAYLLYRHYKKSKEDKKEPHTALKNRITFLQKSRYECNSSLNPPECKRRIDSQIRRFKLEERIKKSKRNGS